MGFFLNFPYLSLFVEKIYNVYNFFHLRLITAYLSTLLENSSGHKIQRS